MFPVGYFIETYWTPFYWTNVGADPGDDMPRDCVGVAMLEGAGVADLDDTVEPAMLSGAGTATLVAAPATARVGARNRSALGARVTARKVCD